MQALDQKDRLESKHKTYLDEHCLTDMYLIKPTLTPFSVSLALSFLSNSLLYKTLL